MIKRFIAPERRAADQVLNRAAYRERIRNHEGAISRGSKADVDVSQTQIQNARNLRDTDGVFWFVVSYSKVGGPDRIPET